MKHMNDFFAVISHVTVVNI